MSVTARQYNENRILAALPAEDFQRLSPHLEPIELHLGQILYEAGSKIEYVYFPLNSMVSLISQLSDGSSIEIGVAGYEGMVGIYAVLGVDRTPHEGLVQVPGGAVRVKTSVIVEEFKRVGALQPALLRYLQMLLLQTSQIAACNRLHTISERLARWLLMSQDRCRCDDLPFTQDFIALMLGTRRAGVTEAAILLQAEEYITYRRGHIKILDRAGMEDYACECYRIVKDEFDRVVG